MYNSCHTENIKTPTESSTTVQEDQQNVSDNTAVTNQNTDIQQPSTNEVVPSTTITPTEANIESQLNAIASEMTKKQDALNAITLTVNSTQAQKDKYIALM